MGMVVSIDLARQRKQGGQGHAEPAGTGGGGFDGLTPAEYQGLADLFNMARDAGIVVRMTVQPLSDGFLCQAFATVDPFYPLFEIEKSRNGRLCEYQGRARHRPVARDFNFYQFMTAMRVEIARLIGVIGPGRGP